MDPNLSPNLVRFGIFELDLRARELRKRGASTGLPEQSIRILALLLDKPGEVVLRQEIRKKLWPNDTVVEFDHSINAAIKRLRQALGDPADDPQYIETLARRGYRWMVPLDSVRPDSPDVELPKTESFASRLIGRKVSHYRVLDILGGGGMGVVYKAEDIKLGRLVAMKFLPEEMAGDPAALERFEREARAASALDHPNICSIYEFGEHEGQPFIVMQLLEGQTLRERIGAASSQTSKPLATKMVLDFAIQITCGLEAAHQKGIIHRDIKPSNVFLTSRGEAKILDFGVAKLIHGEGQLGTGDHPESCDNTVPSDPSFSLSLTRTGTTVGTASYMSPEQILGEKLDARTDLFSFGLVLYEMATGQQAFSRDTAELIREAILHRSVQPARELNPELPAKIEEVITKALQKNRHARFQTASEVRATLEGIRRDLEPRVRVPFWPKLASGLAMLVLVASTALWLIERQPSASPSSRELKVRELTFNSQETGGATGLISPDGKYLAYYDAAGVHIQLVETGESHSVQGFQVDKAVWEVAAWFPDSTRFVVNSHPLGEDQTSWSSEGSSVWLVSVLGAAPRKLRDRAYVYSVSPDGSLISFGTNKGRLGDREIWLMDANGEHARKLFDTGEDSTIGGLVWSPQGKWTVYQVQDDFGTAIISRDLNGGAPKTLVQSSPSNNGAEYLWLPDGRLVYISQGVPEPSGGSCTFWQVRLDLKSGKPIDRPSCLAYWPASHISDLSMTADGKRLAFRKLTGHNTTYVADFDAKRLRIANAKHFTLSNSVDLPADWTADSKAIIITSNRAGHIGIYKQGLTDGTAQPLVPGVTGLQNVRMSADGNWILYLRDPEPETSPSSMTEVLRVPINGGVPEGVTKVRAGSLLLRARAPSKLCAIAEPTEDRKQVVIRTFDPMKGLGPELARFTPDSIANAWALDLSPDGTRIAAIRSPEGPIQILSLNGQPTHEIRVKGWSSMHTLNWTSDGKGILVSNGSQGGAVVLHVDLRGNAEVLWKNPGVNWTPSLESPDGRHFAFQSAPMESNVWLMENF